MSPIFLALFLGVLLLNLAPRLFPRRGKRRPVFRQSGVLPGPLAEGLLHSLITDRGRFRADTHIAGFIGEAPMVERSGGCGRLVLYPAPAHGRESDLDGIKRLAHHGFKGPRPTLVVIGGSAAFGEAAFCASAPLRALHIDDLGQVRERRDRFRSTAPRLAVEAALDDMAGSLREGTLPQIGTELARRLAFEDAASPGTARPPALITLSLTAAILLCFALQVATSRDSLWGSGASFAVVYRMGGLYRESILAGEWQRLIAAPFLHFGLVHLAMNGWAQWSLGSVIESLLGPRRYLVLWTGSAVGASLTSVAMNEATLAAGASGAIFGLLGAFTAFVFFRKDFLPQPVPRALRNGIWITLLLNLLISFIPGIDMAAHGGGFLVGGSLAMFMTRHRSEEGHKKRTALLPVLAVALLVVAGVGKTSIDQRLDRTTHAPTTFWDYMVDELRLPIPEGFVVSKAGPEGLTTVMAESPGSPFEVFFRLTPPQVDQISASKRAEELRPKENEAPPDEDDELIALSWRGTQNLRAVEVVVQTPRSCRVEAERLGASLVAAVR